MRKIVLLAIVVGGFSINGCTSIFSNASLKNINSYEDARRVIKNGMTKTEVESVMGRPLSRRTFNGKTTWVYGESKTSALTFKNILYQAHTGRGVVDVKQVNVTFDSSGRVEDVKYAAIAN